MLSAQGPVHDPRSFVALIVVVAIAAIVWWRAALMIIAIGLLVLFGLGAMAMFHAMHVALR
jgi:hypothetical protein